MFVTIEDAKPGLPSPPSRNEFLFFNDPRDGGMRSAGRHGDIAAAITAALSEASGASPLAAGATRFLVDTRSQSTYTNNFASFGVTGETVDRRIWPAFRTPRRRKRQVHRRPRRPTQHRDSRRRRSDRDRQGGPRADLRFRHPLGRRHGEVRRHHSPRPQRAPREGQDQHYSIKTPRSLLPRRLHRDVPGWRRRSAHRYSPTTADARVRSDRRTDTRRVGDAAPR